MDNKEEVYQLLEEFDRHKPKDIPRELEEYLNFVAKTGDPIFLWSKVKFLFRQKLQHVLCDYYESCPNVDITQCPNVEQFNFDVMKNKILEKFESFSSKTFSALQGPSSVTREMLLLTMALEGPKMFFSKLVQHTSRSSTCHELNYFSRAPFTIQRLCELLTSPRKEYNRTDKFMRAVEKNVLVVTTQEPGVGERGDTIQSPVVNGVDGPSNMEQDDDRADTEPMDISEPSASATSGTSSSGSTSSGRYSEPHVDDEEAPCSNFTEVGLSESQISSQSSSSSSLSSKNTDDMNGLEEEEEEEEEEEGSEEEDVSEDEEDQLLRSGATSGIHNSEKNNSLSMVSQSNSNSNSSSSSGSMDSPSADPVQTNSVDPKDSELTTQHSNDSYKDENSENVDPRLETVNAIEPRESCETHVCESTPSDVTSENEPMTSDDPETSESTSSVLSNDEEDDNNSPDYTIGNQEAYHPKDSSEKGSEQSPVNSPSPKESFKEEDESFEETQTDTPSDSVVTSGEQNEDLTEPEQQQDSPKECKDNESHVPKREATYEASSPPSKRICLQREDDAEMNPNHVDADSVKLSPKLPEDVSSEHLSSTTPAVSENSNENSGSAILSNGTDNEV